MASTTTNLGLASGISTARPSSALARHQLLLSVLMRALLLQPLACRLKANRGQSLLTLTMKRTSEQLSAITPNTELSLQGFIGDCRSSQ